MPAFFVRLCVFSTHPYFEKTNLFKFFKIEGERFYLSWLITPEILRKLVEGLR